MTFSCDTCGPLPHALYDGYAFGDWLLEGVLFEVHAKGDAYELKAQDKDGRYLSDLNAAKWLTIGAASVADEDTLTCPICGADIDGPAAG